MTINNNVTAQGFIQVVFSDRQRQADIVGKWFSSKENGKQLKAKAERYLDNYKNYVSYLQQVVNLPTEELDKELFKANVLRQTKNMTEDEKRQMIQALQQE